MLPAQVCRASCRLWHSALSAAAPGFRPSLIAASSASSTRLGRFSTCVRVDKDVGPTTTTSQPLPGKLEPRLSLTFTCTAADCGERSTHEFSKQAYTSGIVLVQCPKCKNRHLIADHLGWFKELTGEGRQRTVEDLVKAT